jgi:hypothetical protein
VEKCRGVQRNDIAAEPTAFLEEMADEEEEEELLLSVVPPPERP